MRDEDRRPNYINIKNEKEEFVCPDCKSIMKVCSLDLCEDEINTTNLVKCTKWIAGCTKCTKAIDLTLMDVHYPKVRLKER